jgi:hypothetical protein
MQGNVVDVKVSSDSLMHLEMLLDAGMMTGARGSRQVNPTIRLLVDALYNVLAGGSVTGTVPGTLTVTAGVATKVQAIQDEEKKCVTTINDINRGQAYNLVVEV